MTPAHVDNHPGGAKIIRAGEGASARCPLMTTGGPVRDRGREIMIVVPAKSEAPAFREQSGQEIEHSIVKALEEDIIFGGLAPGTRLTEDMLLARFPVTRHFVRQALVQLEAMGVVVRERNKGATVRSLTPDEVRQIYSVRELVQRQAALWDSAARAR